MPSVDSVSTALYYTSLSSGTSVYAAKAFVHNNTAEAKVTETNFFNSFIML